MRKGFSLIETIASVAIVAIVAAVATVLVLHERAKSRDMQLLAGAKGMQAQLVRIFSTVGAYPSDAAAIGLDASRYRYTACLTKSGCSVSDCAGQARCGWYRIEFSLEKGVDGLFEGVHAVTPERVE